MSKTPKRRHHRPSPRAATAPAAAAPAFTPVPVRPRHDGWTPARQLAFVQALAASANVEEACRAVGKSPHSFYDLRRRPDAASFRQAVQAALDVGVERLADAMLGRAITGVARPIFYKGEQVGEHRTYDERLGMFILRSRAPERYGKWRDGMRQTRAHPDGAARVLGAAVRVLAEEGLADAQGRPRPRYAPLKPMRLMDDPAEVEAMAREEEAREQAEAEESLQRYVATTQAEARNAPRRQPALDPAAIDDQDWDEEDDDDAEQEPVTGPLSPDPYRDVPELPDTGNPPRDGEARLQGVTEGARSELGTRPGPPPPLAQAREVPLPVPGRSEEPPRDRGPRIR